MTKLEKLQKEYPMFELIVAPASDFLKKCYIEAGCNEPKRMLVFCYKDFYNDYIGDFDWSISTLRKNLDRWASKI